MRKPVTINFFKYWYRRWHSRNWRCRCGKKIWDNSALGSSPLAPTIPDSNCAWHKSVRMQVLRGKITRPEDAR